MVKLILLILLVAKVLSCHTHDLLDQANAGGTGGTAPPVQYNGPGATGTSSK